jgi:molybdopterin converting factor small subunit
MKERQEVTIRFFGALHTARKDKGLPSETTLAVPAGGKPAEEVARELGLPLERIEAVFCNHVIHDLSYLIRPGDEVAFVPHGTPGPHRFTLGIHAAGRRAARPQSA